MSSLGKTIKKLVPQPVKAALMNRYYQIRSQRMHPLAYDPMAYPAGVNLLGYIYAEMGLGQGCRCIAAALRESGLPFTIVNYAEGPSARMDDRTWSDFVGPARYGVNLVQINADQIPRVRVRMGRDFWDKRCQIAHFAWELPEFPSQWRAACNCFDEIWTPSRFCTDAIARQTHVPVYTMPFCIHPEISQPREREHFHLPENRFLYLTMFDVNSVMERKNPIGAIRAYCRAFPDVTGRTGLVVKINNFTRLQKTDNTLYELIRSRSDIFLLDEVLSRGDLNALIQTCDCFVSLHRSEGFGLVLAEAMYLGRPVVATNWSSNTDFMTAENSCPVNYRLVPLERDYAVYRRGQHWAAADESHCVSYMRRLYEDPAYYEAIARAGQASMQRQYSAQASAEFLLRRLTPILKGE